MEGGKYTVIKTADSENERTKREETESHGKRRMKKKGVIKREERNKEKQKRRKVYVEKLETRNFDIIYYNAEMFCVLRSMRIPLTYMYEFDRSDVINIANCESSIL